MQDIENFYFHLKEQVRQVYNTFQNSFHQPQNQYTAQLYQELRHYRHLYPNYQEYHLDQNQDPQEQRLDHLLCLQIQYPHHHLYPLCQALLEKDFSERNL